MAEATNLDIIALAKAETAALRKSGKELDGAVNVTTLEDGVVSIDITGFIYFDQLVELKETVILAGKDLKKVIVNINSPGGSAFAGVAIANFLKMVKADVTTIVESAAMSAAAIIFMSGKERLMGPVGSNLMFHRAMGWIDILSFGNRKDLEKVDVVAVKTQQLDVLDSLDAIIVDLMTKGTKLSKSEAEELMEAEKQIGKDNAIKYGLATGVASENGTESPTSEEEETKEDENSSNVNSSEETPDERAIDIALMSMAQTTLTELERSC